MSSVIQVPGKIRKELETDEIENDGSCWQEVFKARDTRKMGKTARCLTLFHNITIMVIIIRWLLVNFCFLSLSLSLSLFVVRGEGFEAAG